MAASDDHRLSAVIEEDGLFTAGGGGGGGGDSGGVVSMSQTPTTDSSRRSSQRSTSAASEQGSGEATTIPKSPLSEQQRQLSVPHRVGGGGGAGVRQVLAKQRRKASATSLDSSSRRQQRGSGFFTLDHVKKFFGPAQLKEGQGMPTPQQQQLNRRASGGDVASSPSDDLELKSRLSRLSVDALPAVFLAKYLGEAPAAGLFGVDSVRRPVDALVKAAGKRKAKTDRPLPIAQLTVLAQGVSVRPHPQSEGGQVARAFHAIDSVSYAVMDPDRPRIFCLVVADSEAAPSEASAAAGSVRPACHAFLCNSADTAYRLVLAVTFAFETATSAAEGGPNEYENA